MSADENSSEQEVLEVTPLPRNEGDEGSDFFVDEDDDSEDDDLLLGGKVRAGKKVNQAPEVIHVLLRTGLRKKEDGVESGTKIAAKVTLPFGIHVARSRDGGLYLKDPHATALAVQKRCPDSMSSKSKQAVAYSHDQRYKCAGDSCFDMSKPETFLNLDVPVKGGSKKKPPTVVMSIVAKFKVDERSSGERRQAPAGRSSSSSSSSSSLPTSFPFSSYSSPSFSKRPGKEDNILESPQANKKQKKAQQSTAVYEFNRTQLYSATLLSLNIHLKRRNQPSLNQHQRESLAEKLDIGDFELPSSQGGEEVWGYDDIFNVGNVSDKVSLQSEFVDAVKDGRVDFSGVEGYGTDAGSSSTGGDLGNSLSSIASAAASFMQMQAHASKVSQQAMPQPSQQLSLPAASSSITPTQEQTEAAEWAVGTMEEAMDDDDFEQKWQDASMLLDVDSGSWSQATVLVAKVAVRLKAAGGKTPVQVAKRLASAFKAAKKMIS